MSGIPVIRTYLSTTTVTFPPLVTRIRVQVWGCGGAGAGGGIPGGHSNNQQGGEGGGGGLYAAANVTVVPGTPYDVTINPFGGSNQFASGDELVYAESGHSGGAGGGHGQGGIVAQFGANTSNTLVYPGGKGGTSTDDGTGGGGGGGGGGPMDGDLGQGPGEDGANTADELSGEGGLGGGQGGGGGSGGNGGEYGSGGTVGQNPGGGGGGGGGFDDDPGTSTPGSNGGVGQIIIYYVLPCEARAEENSSVDEFEDYDLQGLADDPEADPPITTFAAAGGGPFYYSGGGEVGIATFENGDLNRIYQEQGNGTDEQHTVFNEATPQVFGFMWLLGGPIEQWQVEEALFDNGRVTKSVIDSAANLAARLTDSIHNMFLWQSQQTELNNRIRALGFGEENALQRGAARSSCKNLGRLIIDEWKKIQAISRSANDTATERRAVDQAWKDMRGTLRTAVRPGEVRVTLLIGGAVVIAVVAVVFVENPNLGNEISRLRSPRPTLQNTGRRMQARLSLTGAKSEALVAHEGSGSFLYLAGIDGIDDPVLTMTHKTTTTLFNNNNPQILLENWRVTGCPPLNLNDISYPAKEGTDASAYLNAFNVNLGPDNDRTRFSIPKAGIPCDIFAFVKGDSYNPGDASRLVLFYCNWDDEVTRGYELVPSTVYPNSLYLDLSVQDSGGFSDMHLYLGTILPTTDGTTINVPFFRFVWNHYNPMQRVDTIEDDYKYWLVNPLMGAGNKSPMHPLLYGWRYSFVDPQDGNAPPALGSLFPIVESVSVTGYGPIGMQIKHYDAYGDGRSLLRKFTNADAKDESQPNPTDGTYSYSALRIQQAAGWQHSGGLNTYKVIQYVLPGALYPFDENNDRVKYGYFGSGASVPIGQRGIWENDCDGPIIKENPAGLAKLSVRGAF